MSEEDSKKLKEQQELLNERITKLKEYTRRQEVRIDNLEANAGFASSESMNMPESDKNQ